MTINKFQGKTKEEAMEKARQEFGENVVIMNVKEIKPKGLFRAFKSSTYEVTAAVEDKEPFVNPLNSMTSSKRLHEGINLAADEKINVSPARQEDEKKPVQREYSAEGVRRPMLRSSDLMSEPSKAGDKKLEERLENLSSIIEEKLKSSSKEDDFSKTPTSEELNFVRILYSTLLNNEVNEKYVNQILDEVERFVRPGSNVDMILSNVYQKLILRFGQPHPIELAGKKPKVIFFIGPTGVGKTTTIAKIASKYKVEMNKKVAFLTADTYRIAATEQLRVYANILDAPMSIIYSQEELNSAIDRVKDYDIVFVDTAGFSHKNESQREDIKNLIQGMKKEYEKEVFLVLSATTKYKDLVEISDIYREISEYKLIFTKLDETTTFGNILNIKLHSGAELSYVTNGQNVPEDMEVFNTQKIVKQLLGGR